MVRKGMRNVFAPPTPPSKIAPVPQGTVPDVPAVPPNLKAATLPAFRMSTCPPVAGGADVPEDLEAIIGNLAKDTSSALASTLGLPPVPPPNRITPRRNNAFAPPAISLPPVPDIPAHLAPGGRVSPVPPQLTLDITDEDPGRPTTFFSDCLSPVEAGFRNSFDFTGEYAALDLGTQRASFVQALAQVQSANDHFAGFSSMPFAPTSCGPTSQRAEVPHETSKLLQDDDELMEVNDSGSEDEEEDEMEDALEREIATAVVLTPSVQRTPRQAPFQGQIAFQKHVAQTRASPPKLPVLDFSAPTHVEEPAQAPVEPPRRRGHRRDESGLSIASMSSMGSVIETGIAGEYTNYFEVNFRDHLARQGVPPLPPLPSLVAQAHSRTSSIDSVSSRVSRRAHHRRNSSIISVDPNMLPGAMGPPVSMDNHKRSSYVSRHRRGLSGESFGRSDWAAQHRRNASIESQASNSSIQRLGRPGLGERMFQRDGGIQLTSITGSPADYPPSPAQADRDHELSRMDAYVSFNASDDLGDENVFGSSVPSKQTVVSSRSDEDSVFNIPTRKASSSFLLKGLRPASAASNADSNTDVELHDESSILRKLANTGMSPVPKGPIACLEGEGEDISLSEFRLPVFARVTLTLRSVYLERLFLLRSSAPECFA